MLIQVSREALGEKTTDILLHIIPLVFVCERSAFQQFVRDKMRALTIAQSLAKLPDTELAAVLHYLAELRGSEILADVLQALAQLDEPRDEALRLVAQQDIQSLIAKIDIKDSLA